jgi:ligand-binding sensor domain-containing protein
MAASPRAFPWSRRWWTRGRVVAAVVLLAALLRAWAAWQLPVDYDEPVYLKAGFDYAEAIRAGDWNAIIDYAGNREHPPLVKLMYGAGVLALGENATWDNALLAGRLISAFFGTLTVLIVALADPLAGGMLAVHTLAVKYTSQAYLEALPLFAAVAAVLALRRAKGRDRWFWLSASALGLTAAGKLSYFPIVFVILYVAMWEKRARWPDLLAYFAAAAAAFLLLNPTLWRDPLPRLAESLTFHAQYSRSAHVEQIGYPWFQPLAWVAFSVPWHPEVFFYGGFDGLIFLFMLGGAWWQWRERRWAVVWIATSLLTLLVWPTKWPQYALVVVPALCFVAAPTAAWIYRWVAEQETYWDWLQQMVPRPPRAFWFLVGLLVLGLTGGYVATRIEVMQEQRKWSHFNAANTPLPNNTVYDIAAGTDGKMLLGTSGGAVIWLPPENAAGPDFWQVFTTDNSGLPDNDVLAAVEDPSGAMWFGTEAGLARYAGGVWQTFRARDMGLQGERIHTLAAGDDGRLWVGTDAGAAVFDGQTWAAFPPGSGLGDSLVLSIAGEPGGGAVWFGAGTGLSRLDAATGEWRRFTSQNSPLGAGGVADVIVDSAGRVWAATLGGGLGVWDGQTWRTYNVSNAAISSNTVQEVFEDDAGVVWVGTSWPTEYGGALVSLEGSGWKQHLPGRSGFSGAEALSIAQDTLSRIWIGTWSAGVDVYEPQR